MYTSADWLHLPMWARIQAQCPADQLHWWATTGDRWRRIKIVVMVRRLRATHTLTLDAPAALSVIISVLQHGSLEKWSEPKWKGYVCLCWPVLRCLTTAHRLSKELPQCCDPLPHGEGFGRSLCFTPLGSGPSLRNSSAVEADLQSPGLGKCTCSYVNAMEN